MAASIFSGPGPVPIARIVVTPAARARSNIASRSSANCGKSMCACESISSIVFVALALLPVRFALNRATRYFDQPRQVRQECACATKRELPQARADLDVFVGKTGEYGAPVGS